MKQKITLTIELSPIEDRLILTACDEQQNYTRIKSESFSYDLQNPIPLKDVAEKHLIYSFAQLTPIIVSTVLGLKEELE